MRTKILLLPFLICTLFSCGKTFHEKAESKYFNVIDSLVKDDSISCAIAKMHGKNVPRLKYIDHGVVCENDTVYIRQFDAYWPSDGYKKPAYFVYAKNKRGQEFEVHKPRAFFLSVIAPEEWKLMTEGDKCLFPHMWGVAIVAGNEVK